MSRQPVVVCADLSAHRHSQRPVLSGLDLTVGAGCSVAVMGPSGGGKSTLLSVLCGLLLPTGGTVDVAGTRIYDLTLRQRTAWRLSSVGYVSQFGGLLDELTVLENVELPLRLGRPVGSVSAIELIDSLGLSDCATSRADELSGGQIQRTAIARALVGSPHLLLADEPTGALDDDSSAEVARCLIEASQRAGTALVVATHDADLARQLGEIRLLRHGRLVSR